MVATTYDERSRDAICARIADGESVRHICADTDMPNKATVMRWLADHEDFRLAYAAACEIRAEALAEEALDIADDATRDTKMVGREGEEREACDTEWVARSKLRIETRKWLAGVMNPKKYGAKLDLNHGGEVAVTIKRFTPEPPDGAT